MSQPFFLELAGITIQEHNLLKLGMEIDSYNDHCSAPCSRACWLVSTTNFTPVWEPTLSWNQFRALTRSGISPHASRIDIAMKTTLRHTSTSLHGAIRINADR